MRFLLLLLLLLSLSLSYSWNSMQEAKLWARIKCR